MNSNPTLPGVWNNRTQCFIHSIELIDDIVVIRTAQSGVTDMDGAIELACQIHPKVRRIVAITIPPTGKDDFILYERIPGRYRAFPLHGKWDARFVSEMEAQRLIETTDGGAK
jgi:hypothetical protein